MKVLLPCGYFPPISFFGYLVQHEAVFEAHEHFVKQSLRNRCTILGANGPLNLLVPKVKGNSKQVVTESLIHDETDWKKLHWRSLEASYRNSPYFEYYEDDLKPFFEKPHKHHFQTAIESVELIGKLLNTELRPEFTENYEPAPSVLDCRNAWNKREYATNAPFTDFPKYIQVFSDRQPFAPDLSILDLLFCAGPHSVDYLQNLKLREN